MFNITTLDDSHKQFGIYFLMSFFNHSCIPNSKNVPQEEKISSIRIMKSIRDIMPGEEITYPYDIDLSDDPEVRKKYLKQKFAFDCTCKACTIQGHDQPSSSSEYNHFICRGCGEMKSDMMRCSKCKRVYYCSKECQNNGYRFHKRNCKEWSRSRSETIKNAVSVCFSKPDNK